ncbi:hypothetical protein ACS0TY_025639 [Phlomoides rotata]
MGKYTRKGKMTADVALTDVSQSYLGVRTRAKSLALQRLQSTAAAPPKSDSDADYLELRSRRLEKTMQPHNSRSVQNTCGFRGKENAEIGRHEQKPIEEGQGLGIEDSCGENDSNFEARERGTRESTPCSLIRATDTITPPGSTSKQAYSRASSPTSLQDAFLINGRELEELFAREEQLMQRHFTQKYNFDFVKEAPLPGRYEWVAVRP